MDQCRPLTLPAADAALAPGAMTGFPRPVLRTPVTLRRREPAEIRRFPRVTLFGDVSPVSP
jgi:hypothetical protein